MKHVELEFERRCRAAARLAGWVALKVEKNGHKGVPDDLFISPDGKCILIEFKKDTKQKPRPEQTLWLEKFPFLCFLVGDERTFCSLLGLPFNDKNDAQK